MLTAYFQFMVFFSLFTLGLIFDLELKQAEEAAMVSNLFLVLLSQFYHSAARIRLPWLDRVLVTPQVHRIHHSLDRKHHEKKPAYLSHFYILHYCALTLSVKEPVELRTGSITIV